ncbi:hypothetical protein C9374_010103 [Naegleria lovaniensis]|uniref:Phytanoyl-CoA dioxygenase n=1 Tax=Naegleria lovaniensis TaxID=51637 RepID=A0AA88GGY8_NAELO|nr:uncharacterized protein C9374_010103 [Naegleria lovaniensis]KAG2375099.1 hypothetical protein C9374_010103 [Naegleria lovaniensis]
MNNNTASSSTTTSYRPAMKIADALSIVLNNPHLIPFHNSPLMKLEIEPASSSSGGGKKKKHQHSEVVATSSSSGLQIIPFSDRNKVIKTQIVRILLDTHTLWERSDQNDALSNPASIQLIVQLQTKQLPPNALPLHPNTITTAEQVDDALEMNRFVKQFLIDGYLVIDPAALKTCGPSFHREMLELGLSVRNHLTTKIPQILHVFSDSTVKKVLTRLLGKDYETLSTTHMHLSQRGRLDQHWHKDDFQDGYIRPVEPATTLNHVMAMYYPQDTTIEMGPTAIRRGTHYEGYSNDYVPDRYVFDQNQTKYREVALTCRAGTIVMLHYEIVHRRMKNTLTDRFMMKFQFRRRQQPPTACGLNASVQTYDEVDPIDTDYDHPFIDPLARKIWNWMNGLTN